MYTSAVDAKPKIIEQARPFLTAEWRYLLMMNFEVDPDLLQPRVPEGLELDFHGERTFISLIGFRFLDTRVLNWALPFHRNFDEINLRFYVRRRVDGEWRRGVMFIKEIVPRRLISFVARAVYNENYVRRPMRSRVELRPGLGSGSLGYEWKQNGRWNRMISTIAGEAFPAAADSEAMFVTEHYWGYAAQKDGSVVEYQVEHPRWRIWPALTHQLDVNADAEYGPQFARALRRQPTSVFVADGSPVTVRRGRPLGCG